MWRTWLPTLLAPALISCALGTAQGKQRYAVYSDNVFKYSFHYPANWVRLQNPVLDALFSSRQDDALIGEETLDEPMDHTTAVVTALAFYQGLGTLLQNPALSYRTIHGQTYVASTGLVRTNARKNVVVQILFALFTHHTFMFVGAVIYAPCRQTGAPATGVVTEGQPLAADVGCNQSRLPATAAAEKRLVDDSLASIVFWP